MKNLILGIENLYIGPLFNGVSIFEKNLTMTWNFETWIFYAVFLKGLSKPIFLTFEFRFFRLKVLGGWTNVRNGLVWPQMTSQIAGIDILHMYWVRWHIYANMSKNRYQLTFHLYAKIRTKYVQNTYKICQKREYDQKSKKHIFFIFQDMIVWFKVGGNTSFGVILNAIWKV